MLSVHLSQSPPLPFFFWLCRGFVDVHGLSLVAVSRDYSPVAVRGHLAAVASLVAEQGL